MLGAHAQVDLDGAVFVAEHGPPIGWLASDGLPRLHALGSPVAAQLADVGARALREGLIDEAPVLVLPQGRSRDGTRWVVRAEGQLDRAELLWDQAADTLRRLDRRDRDEAFRRSLSAWEPVSFTASDGRRLSGLLQMLANRGYAVLQVNDRGSAGYGREHMWAGARTYGERLQRDIADGVQ